MKRKVKSGDILVSPGFYLNSYFFVREVRQYELVGYQVHIRLNKRLGRAIGNLVMVGRAELSLANPDFERTWHKPNIHRIPLRARNTLEGMNWVDTQT